MVKVTIGRLGIVEKEEDSLENILNQDAEDKRMEQMEEKVRKMMECKSRALTSISVASDR